MLTARITHTPDSELICNGSFGAGEPSHYGVTDKTWGIIFLASLGAFATWVIGAHFIGGRQEEKLDRYFVERRKVLARRFP